MQAISLRPEWAMPVMLGWKSIECRTWKTDYRGDLLICSSSKPLALTIDSHALAVVELIDIVPFEKNHLEDAFMEEMPEKSSFAWILDNLRWIKPFKQKGKLHLFEVDDSLIEILPDEMSNVECLRTYYEPLMNFGRNEKERLQWEEIVAEFKKE